jgi:hypothetical protein
MSEDIMPSSLVNIDPAPINPAGGPKPRFRGSIIAGQIGYFEADSTLPENRASRTDSRRSRDAMGRI